MLVGGFLGAAARPALLRASAPCMLDATPIDLLQQFPVLTLAKSAEDKAVRSHSLKVPPPPLL